MSDPTGKIIQAATLKDAKEEDIQNMYDEWAENYEKDMDGGNYSGPQMILTEFQKLPIKKDAKIIDILGGTGKVAKELSKSGRKYDMDILDASEKMLEEASKLNLYKNYIQAYLEPNHELPIGEDTYDVAILCGAFVPGHITANVFPQVIRIVKKGGLVTWVINERYDDSNEFSSFDDVVERLCSEGLWKEFQEVKTFEEYLLGSKGRFYCMEVL